MHRPAQLELNGHMKQARAFEFDLPNIREYPWGGVEFNILKSHPVKAKHQYVNRLNPWLQSLHVHYNSLNAVHYLAQNDEHFDSFREM